ncbi:hypothetical protein SERLA73DRAFT_80191 [Serpula lacrymans var. lacrymans S7.3]|uniref:Uncharacterized protein n=2 Tax=Serpula lacrymans var. lacrymans TaxID=341189 RepID=F8QJ06_SERL3|nr:uncharacterized protein SERLADRAFT_433362 [Serpula lacrymans var. lacrymans S7.9]EGN91718.1 hypothetical protein SERLA73DRAFT_80191 [Serpula lacrymans var. lacrymans S7.3]EGO29372.1 hypothetical protein SERLADRAFT_433362 [Serpula lacrymans var. lacrymans S7.9]
MPPPHSTPLHDTPPSSTAHNVKIYLIPDTNILRPTYPDALPTLHAHCPWGGLYVVLEVVAAYSFGALQTPLYFYPPQRKDPAPETRLNVPACAVVTPKSVHPTSSRDDPPPPFVVPPHTGSQPIPIARAFLAALPPPPGVWTR